MNVFCRREWSLLDDNTTCSLSCFIQKLKALLLSSTFFKRFTRCAFIQHDESNYEKFFFQFQFKKISLKIENSECERNHTVQKSAKNVSMEFQARMTQNDPKLPQNGPNYKIDFGAKIQIITLFEIFTFCPKNQLWFPKKNVDFLGWKTRENVVVLDSVAVDKFDFTRKIARNICSEKLVKMLWFWTL